MPRKPKAVPLSKIDDIQASLKQKAATPKTISLEDLVKSLAKPIQDMLDAGYDYSDVAEVFKGHGVELAASSIKSFHKKSLATTTHQGGNDSSVSSDGELPDESSSGSTSEASLTDDAVSPVSSDDSSSSLPNTSEESSDSPSPTPKRRKAAAKEHGQFNVTDRSDL
ncbi:hypothetical protein H6G94_35050 [Nostoc punctiforme FACHB-252]|uniref:Uncharacterized protein n=1 Tax=Nostoc punctiforme FACHB-252 TaxID=1357509 RepID=A0ABR8HN32_NOSPU|nr:hypothetical protein [Nostoc punctiforme]MBD2616385.1 hypothetical protein [Nostoc punctiforme FACHB-252]